MPRSKKLVYWDSNIWIAWLMNERRPEAEMSGIGECIEMVHAGKWVIVSSVEIYTEILAGKIGAAAWDIFEKVCLRRGVQIVPKDVPIARLAGELRDFYDKLKAKDGKKTLSTADATHLATAIVMKVDEFQTFDDGKKDGPKGRSLLSLDGNVGGYRLKVCKPRGVQLGLGL